MASFDPRIAGIGKRLEKVGRVIAVTGGKGGIGKSVVASTLALVAARKGLRAGLLDLDLTGPTAHVLLGVEARLPTEEFGVDPLDADGVAFMSIACFAGESPAPLRGHDVTNALIEILAITNWQELDLLVVDMPPGLGDASLDVVRLLPRAEHLVIATASKLVLETVRRSLGLLTSSRAEILGVLENMRRESVDTAESDAVSELARKHGVPFLGALPFDDTLESRLGSTRMIAASRVAEALEARLETLISEES